MRIQSVQGYQFFHFLTILLIENTHTCQTSTKGETSKILLFQYYIVISGENLQERHKQKLLVFPFGSSPDTYFLKLLFLKLDSKQKFCI